jgi:acyl carrier protein
MRASSPPPPSQLDPLVAERVLAKMAVLLDCDRAHLDAGQRLVADLDFTSLERVQIALDFEAADGCAVSFEEVARAVTVRDLVHVITDALRHAAPSGRGYAEWLALGLRRGTTRKRSSARAA